MKSIRNYMVIITIIFVESSSIACPTCIGTIKDYSPKFFSDDAYIVTDVKESQAHVMTTPNANEKENNEY